MRSAAAKSSTQWQTIALVGATVATLVGIALPWVSVLGVSVTGFGTDLPMQVGLIAAGAIGSLLSLHGSRWGRIAGTSASVVGLSVGGYYFVRLLVGAKGEVFGQSIRISISPGVGLWLIVIGGVVAVSTNVAVWRSAAEVTRRAQRRPAPVPLRAGTPGAGPWTVRDQPAPLTGQAQGRDAAAAPGRTVAAAGGMTGEDLAQVREAGAAFTLPSEAFASLMTSITSAQVEPLSNSAAAAIRSLGPDRTSSAPADADQQGRAEVERAVRLAHSRLTARAWGGGVMLPDRVVLPKAWAAQYLRLAESAQPPPIVRLMQDLFVEGS